MLYAEIWIFNNECPDFIAKTVGPQASLLLVEKRWRKYMYSTSKTFIILETTQNTYSVWNTGYDSYSASTVISTYFERSPGFYSTIQCLCYTLVKLSRKSIDGVVRWQKVNQNNKIFSSLCHILTCARTFNASWGVILSSWINSSSESVKAMPILQVHCMSLNRLCGTRPRHHWKLTCFFDKVHSKS